MTVQKVKTGVYVVSNINTFQDIEEFANVDLPSPHDAKFKLTNEPFEFTFENCRFEHSQINPEGYDAVRGLVNKLNAGNNRNITSLTFRNCHLHGRLLNAFLDYIPNAHRLKKLDFANNAMEPAEMTLIVESLILNSATSEVNLAGNNKMNADVFAMLAYLVKYNQSINKLSLSFIVSNVFAKRINAFFI